MRFLPAELNDGFHLIRFLLPAVAMETLESASNNRLPQLGLLPAAGFFFSAQRYA